MIDFIIVGLVSILGIGAGIYYTIFYQKMIKKLKEDSKE